jgi:hypothetical protein
MDFRADARRLRVSGLPLGLALLAAVGTATPSSAETFSDTLLSAGAGAKTDRRPVPVGFYSATANKTFVSWMGGGTANTAIVKEYNHATGTWTPDKVVGHSSTLDSHNYCSLIEGADNRLYVFHGCHNSPMKMTKSPNPLSIGGTWTDTTISAAAGASYPAPVITSGGTIYVGYRWTRMTSGFSDDRPYCFIKSSDNGATWTRLVVIDPYPRSDNLTEIYNGKVIYEPAHGTQKAKIHLAWTITGGGPGVHAHATYGRNVYYAHLDPANDHMFSVDGTDLGPTISNAEAEAHCKVLDTGCSNCGLDASLQVSAHYLDSGRPIVFYDHLGSGLTSSVWSGSSWVKRTITAQEGEPREIFKFGPQSFKAFRSQDNTCQYYRSTDGGLSWSPEGSVVAPHPVSRCYVIDHHHPDVKLFLEDKGAGADTSTARVTGGFEPWYEVGSATPTPTPTPSVTATPSGGLIEITPGAGGVTASTDDGNLPANTVDGDLSTRWSANGDGQWIRYDLGAVRTVALMKIAAYKGDTRQNRFDLQRSSDGAAWTSILTGALTSGTTTLEEVFDFTDVDARYIRYLGHGNTASTYGSFNSLTEVSLYGPGGTGVTPTPTPTPTPPVSGAFRHPGVLVNRAQLDFVKSKIEAGAEPWTSALAKARNDSHGSLSYTPHPFAVVECGAYSTPNNGCTEEIDDGVAAWTHALLWYYTGNTAHAKKSIEILNAWSSTITSHIEHNAPLQAGWTGATFAAAAEIIKHTGAGWSSTDATRMANKLRTVWLPMVLKTNCGNGNWESIMINASINISVFLDDRASFDQALAMWRNRVPAYSYQTTDGPLPRQTVPNCGRDTRDEIISFWHGQSTFVDGVGQETCRDFGHMEWGLIAQTHAAETAYQQGVDLYAEQSKRLRDALEFHAQYDLGATVPSWLCGGTIKTSTSQSWEIFYNHYATRKGYALPNAKRMILERVRPSGFNRFYGWDTLTHAGVGSVGIP